MEYIWKNINQYKETLSILGALCIARFTFYMLGHIYEGIRSYILPSLFPINLPARFGEWALVTGCTQGIGRGYAISLAKRGMKVILVSRSEEKLRSLAKEIEDLHNVETKILGVDFTEKDAVEKVVNFLEKHKITLGILVNNVGVMGDHMFQSFTEQSQSNVSHIIRVNVETATKLCHWVLPQMLARGSGAIINISSIMSYQAMPYCAMYAASKHFLSALTQALAYEVGGSGVIVQEVDPGHVSTAMTTQVLPATPAPSPYTFAESAVGTLGHSEHTCGWWGHSLHNFVRDILIPNSWVVPMMSFMGRQEMAYRVKRT